MSKSNSFFLDIFNNIIDYNNDGIKILFDVEGNIWFAYNDVLSLLGYRDVKTTIKDFALNEKFKKKFSDIKNNYVVIPKNFQKHVIFINESGLYEILVRSRKSKAKIFLNKYVTEIMPQIRKTGKYISKKTELSNIKKLNTKIDNLKKEISKHKKYNFLPSKNGYLYICKDTQIINGNNVKCYKIGYTHNMHSRMKNYKVGNFFHKLLAYIPLEIDKKQIESCIKTRVKPHLTKLFTDTICYISLNKLKDEIASCINFTYEHICHCIHCSKLYNLTSVNRHKCNTFKIIDVSK